MGPTTESPEPGWDGVNGIFFDPDLTKEARNTEMDWVHKGKVFSFVPRSVLKESGATAILLIWVDTNKEDRPKPHVRSRICVQKGKKGASSVVASRKKAVLSNTVGAGDLDVAQDIAKRGC